MASQMFHRHSPAHDYRVAAGIGHREIELAITIDIAGDDPDWLSPRVMNEPPVNVPSPFPSDIGTPEYGYLAYPPFATAASSFPSALKSSGVTQNRPTRMRPGTLISEWGIGLRRCEQRLERSEKSDCPGTTRMATAAHRARDRGASGGRRSPSESGRDRGAAARSVRTATAGKTGQRGPGDHRVGRGKTDPHDQPQTPTTPESLSTKGKAKATSKPANAVTTGFGVESTGLEVNPTQIRSTGACEPFS
jgi:hypothetical protein